MKECKQPAIAAELRRRITDGLYTGLLPSSRELATEFGVNFKTIDKAVARLVAEGMLERRRRAGTRVAAAPGGFRPDGRLIEVIFEGFPSIFNHPFWGEIWSGLVGGLAAGGFRPVLNMLESDCETGLLRLDGFSMIRASGRVVLGIGEKRLLDRVAAERVPFITACDPVFDAAVPQVVFDFERGIRDAVDFLASHGCRRIAFIGQAQSYTDPGVLRKFDAYRRAIQNYFQLDPALVGHVRPLAGSGRDALARVLERTTPDALLAAYDHQLPGLLELLAERGIDIPVVGCDGLDLPGLPSPRPVVVAPRRRCGDLVAERLIAAITGGGKVRSAALPAVFRH